MYGIAEAIWFLLVPSSHYLAVLGKLPAGLRFTTQRADMFNIVMSTVFWSAAILSLAWLATSGHSNLARWGIVVVFLVHEFVPLFVAIAYGQLHSYVAKLGQDEWAKPLAYVVPILEMIAIACLFSGNARSWFKEQKFKPNA